MSTSANLRSPFQWTPNYNLGADLLRGYTQQFFRLTVSVTVATNFSADTDYGIEKDFHLILKAGL